MTEGDLVGLVDVGLMVGFLVGDPVAGVGLVVGLQVSFSLVGAMDGAFVTSVGEFVGFADGDTEYGG